MPNTKMHYSEDFSGQKFYIGMDVHKKSWSVTVRALDMELAHFTQPPCVQTLVNHLQRTYPGGQFYSAYEAGFCGTTLHEQLGHAGIQNIVVNPADIPMTDKQRKNKTDLHDSRSIAHYLEKGTLHAIHVLSREQQELRSLYRCRGARRKEQTRANNRLKSFLLFMGIELPHPFSEGYITLKQMAWLDNFELSTEAGTLCLKQYLQEYQYQRQKLNEITRLLRTQIQKHYSQAYALLLTMPGYGPIVCSALLAEIGDFKRFTEPDEYSSYLGLLPWSDSSGESIHIKGIQPRCNKYLRYLLVEAAWSGIRQDPELLLYFKKHASKNNKHAIIKVTRKMALMARGMVLNQETYVTGYQKKRKHKHPSSVHREKAIM